MALRFFLASLLALALALPAAAQSVPGSGLNSACAVAGSCTASTTGTSPVLLIAAPATLGLRLWLKSGDCENTGAATSLIALQNGSGGTTLAPVIAPAGGGHAFLFDPPLPLSPNTGLYFAPGTASTTVSCTASAFLAP